MDVCEGQECETSNTDHFEGSRSLDDDSTDVMSAEAGILQQGLERMMKQCEEGSTLNLQDSVPGPNPYVNDQARRLFETSTLQRDSDCGPGSGADDFDRVWREWTSDSHYYYSRMGAS